MSDIVIKAENIGKKYVIGHQAERGGYTALRDVLMQSARTIWHKTKDLAAGKAIIQGDTMEEVWALKGLCFDIFRGEAVGIIGRNGAGKSTLLKILSRITEPSTGRVTIKGRVASLLEVGTGFHPELTGRENIYLNGTILGMTRLEIKRKFDEIVAFAEVEKYLDTPVKRYSSGMYVRLAFAVAAHLEPEILVVDEVLAVGDMAFQKKCLGKMGDVSKEGRTVLFVSHNMTAIKSLCQRGFLLSNGRMVLSGDAEDVVRSYLDSGAEALSEKVWPDPQTAPGDETARIHAVRILDSDGHLTSQTDISSSISIEIEYWAMSPGIPLNVSISIFNSEEVYVLASPSTTDTEWFGNPHPQGLFRSRCVIPGPFFNQGRYSVTALLVNTERSHIIAQLDRIISVDMVDFGDARRGYLGYWGGVIRPLLRWKTVCLNNG